MLECADMAIADEKLSLEKENNASSPFAGNNLNTEMSNFC